MELPWKDNVTCTRIKVDMMFTAKQRVCFSDCSSETTSVTHWLLWSWRCFLPRVSWASSSWGRCQTGTCRTPARCQETGGHSGNAWSPGLRSHPTLWRWWWCRDPWPGRPPSAPEGHSDGEVLIVGVGVLMVPKTEVVTDIQLTFTFELFPWLSFKNIQCFLQICREETLWETKTFH